MTVGAGLGGVGPSVMVKCPKSVLWRPQGSDIGDRHNRIELQSILYTSYTAWALNLLGSLGMDRPLLAPNFHWNPYFTRAKLQENFKKN